MILLSLLIAAQAAPSGSAPALASAIAAKRADLAHSSARIRQLTAKGRSLGLTSNERAELARLQGDSATSQQMIATMKRVGDPAREAIAANIK